MLSDEEKQAIEYLKRHIIPCYGRKGTIEFMLNDIVLNLIEKQSKEIEKLNIIADKYEDLKILYEDNICELEKQQKEIEELKEKNKILETISLSFNEIQDRDKKWEDKIKAKIEIRKEEKANCKDSIEEKYLLREIYILQSLLEKE